MKSGEVLRLVLKQYGFKAAAQELGLALSHLYNWCAPDNGKSCGSLNPLERTAALLRLTGDVRLVQWLCEQAGGYFVPNPQVEAHQPESLLAAERMANQELADQLKVILEAMADGKLTRSEVSFIRRSWESVKSKVEAFVQACEQGKWRGRGQ